mgnify:CR=1 FL=1
MIRSLRRKFIAMTMAIFTALLCVIFGLVIHFTGQTLQADSIRALRQAAQESIQPGIPGQLRQPCFLVRVTPWSQTIQNTGGTVPAEELPLLFDRFHKLDKSRSKNRDGWGLGLYIVKTIVCSHGENISVTSRDGKTEFTFTMPLVN